MRARSASFSSENRGHACENVQHAPHDRHTIAASSGASVVLMMAEEGFRRAACAQSKAALGGGFDILRVAVRAYKAWMLATAILPVRRSASVSKATF